MFNLFSSCLWLDVRLDHVHNFDDSLMQEPTLASFGADALSENEVGNNIRDKRSETSIL